MIQYFDSFGVTTVHNYLIGPILQYNHKLFGYSGRHLLDLLWCTCRMLVSMLQFSDTATLATVDGYGTLSATNHQ